MSISLKNHEDRIALLESRRKEAKMVLSTPILLASSHSRKIDIDCGCDWTEYNFIIVGWSIWGTDEGEGKPSNEELDFVTIPTAYLLNGFWFGHYEIYGQPLTTEDVKISMRDNRTLSVWTDYGRGRITYICLVKN